MRKPELVAADAFGRVGAYGTRVVRMIAVPGSEADVACGCRKTRPTDAQPRPPFAFASVASH